MKTLIVVFAIAFVCLSLHKLDEKDIIRGTYSIHKGLEKSVESSSFEPDGKYLLYGTKVNDTFHHLVAYDPDTGVSLRFTDFYHRDHITQVQYSKDGRKIYTGSQDGTVKIWGNSDGFPLLRTLRAPGKVYHFSINDNQNRLVTVGNVRSGKSIIAVFSLSSGRRMDDGQMFHTDDTFTCDFSHDDESMFATGSDDGTVGFWNVWNFKKIGKYSIENYWKRNYDNSKNEYAIRSVEFDPNGDGLAYAVSTLELDQNNNYGIILKNGTIRHEGHIEGLITHLTWFPQGNRLAISTTLVIANFLIIIDPYDDILYFVFASSHDIFGIDINSEGSQVVIEGSNTLTLLKIEYACPDIRNSISDQNAFVCKCRYGYYWSPRTLRCY